MAHTKGKWNWIDTEAVRSIFNGCSVIASEEIDDAIIATIGEDVPDHKGNARLIAAAPEMLEALRNLVVFAEANDWDKATTGRQLLVDDARKAIRKAEQG